MASSFKSNRSLQSSPSKNQNRALFANILAELTCSVCSEYFITPTSLNCSHVFCLYCIEHWKRQYPRLKALCPVCRTKITCQTHVLAMENVLSDVLGKVFSKAEMTERSRLVDDRRKEQRKEAIQVKESISLDLSQISSDFSDLFEDEDSSARATYNSDHSDDDDVFSDFFPVDDSSMNSQTSTITVSSVTSEASEDSHASILSDIEDAFMLDESDLLNDATLFSDVDSKAETFSSEDDDEVLSEHLEASDDELSSISSMFDMSDDDFQTSYISADDAESLASDDNHSCTSEKDRYDSDDNSSLEDSFEVDYDSED